MTHERYFWVSPSVGVQGLQPPNRFFGRAGLGPTDISDTACACTRPKYLRITASNHTWAKKGSQTQPARTLGQRCQSLQIQTKPFRRLGRPELSDAACAYIRPTNPRLTAPNTAWAKEGSQTQPVRTLGKQFKGLQPQTKPGPAWALRHSLCVHSANKSKVYSPKQGLGKKRS
jgi:hypothetical protein